MFPVFREEKEEETKRGSAHGLKLLPPALWTTLRAERTLFAQDIAARRDRTFRVKGNRLFIGGIQSTSDGDGAFTPLPLLEQTRCKFAH